ncbi:hypothetical protein ACFQX7_08780 [Luedemannella flava]
MLIAALGPLAIRQLDATRDQVRRNHALAAAEAGLEAMLGQLRAVADARGIAPISKLPCGPLTGAVSAAAPARYQVTVDYLDTDPQGRTDAWVTANRLTCTAGTGTTRAPAYALLRAVGTDSATGAFSSVPVRRLRATYVMRKDAQYGTGGLIHAYRPTGANDMCIDAVSDAFAVDTQAELRLCDPNRDTQKFAYNENLNLVLIASRTPLGRRACAWTSTRPRTRRRSGCNRARCRRSPSSSGSSTAPRTSSPTAASA